MAGKQYNVFWPGWSVAGILGHGSYGKVYAIERMSLAIRKRPL